VTVTPAYLPLVTLAVIVGLLLAEARVSKVHEARLRAQGAVQPEGDVYLALAWLYPAAFLAMGLEGMWRASIPVVPGGFRGPAWYASGVVMFAASKALKYWAIASLGERWTFKVFVVRHLPLVTTGPYRYVAHPNYIAVIGELVGTAMMMRAALTGPLAIALFGLALAARIRFENRVLSTIGR
jgi:methyltransferase